MRLALAIVPGILSLLLLAVAAGQTAVTDPAGDLAGCQGGPPVDGPGIADIVSASAALGSGSLRWTVELAEPLPEQPPPDARIRLTFTVIDPRSPLRPVGFNREINFDITNEYSVTLLSLDEGVAEPALPGEWAVNGAEVTITSPAASWDVNAPEDGRGFLWTVASSAFIGEVSVCDFVERREPAYEVAGVAPGPGPTPPPDLSSLSVVPFATPTEEPEMSDSGDDGGLPLWALAAPLIGALLLTSGVGWWLLRRGQR